MGLYANGLRVLRTSTRAAGHGAQLRHDYLFRRWQRHDGTEVACASEKELCSEPDLQSLGIRRWKLQKALCDASAAAGIKIRWHAHGDGAPREDGRRTAQIFADGLACRACRIRRRRTEIEGA